MVAVFELGTEALSVFIDHYMNSQTKRVPKSADLIEGMANSCIDIGHLRAHEKLLI